MRVFVLGLAVAVAPIGAAADVVHLTSGGQVSGRIVERTATTIAVDIGAGRITVPTSSVVRIEEGRSALHEYEDRAGAIAADDVEGWLTLGAWANAQGLGSQAKEAYNRALSVAPDDRRANEALGRTQGADGRWLTEDESYQARGFVRFAGEWMTPAEHEAILRERELDAHVENQRRQADAAAREAEARQAEADARVRQAEAEAAEAASDNGIPLWYGWGAGPTVWPSGPVIYPSQPIRNRGRVR